MGLFSLLAGVAKMCSSTSRLLSGRGCAHSTRDKLSSTRLRAIAAKSPRPIFGSSSGIAVLSVAGVLVALLATYILRLHRKPHVSLICREAIEQPHAAGALKPILAAIARGV